MAAILDSTDVLNRSFPSSQQVLQNSSAHAFYSQPVEVHDALGGLVRYTGRMVISSGFGDRHNPN